MIRFVWNSIRGYWLRPSLNPYLRWRIETYSGMHAEQISGREFWGFVWAHRRDLWRFLRWAGAMRAEIS